MKVLFVGPYVPSLIRVRPFQFIRGLSEQGHEITLLAAAMGKGDEDTSPLARYTSRLEVVRIPRTQSLRSCAIAAVVGDPLQAAVSHGPALDARLGDLLRQQRFDVVHIEHLRSARLVHLLPRNLPRLYDAVDSISLLLERTLQSSHSWRQRVIAAVELQRTRAFEGRIVRHFDETIVTSADDANILRRLSSGAEMHVLPNGVDQDYFQPIEAAREAATLVFSGKMSYHANVTAVLHFARSIFPRIRAERPDTRLVVVGSSPSAEVRELARDPAIEVTGEVADIRPYLGTATLAVCPMVVKVGIQNKLLEAMAMAIPTVSTRQGAVGLFAEPGHDLLVADDPPQFAEHVLALLADPVRAAAIGRNGLEYVRRHHNWGAAVRRLVELYGEAHERRMAVLRSR